MSAQPEVKKSKVVSAEYVGTFTSQYGVDFEGKKVLFKHRIKFENGNTGQYACKQQNQNKFVVGQELEYQWINGEYPKIKTVQSNNNFAGGGRKFDPVFDKKRQIMIILQCTLKSATEFHTQNGFIDGDTVDIKRAEICDTMEFFAERIMRNKYLKACK